jgi:tetratricopeptide (TPR) repeat protein
MMKKLNYGKKADSIEFVTKALVQNWAPLKDTLRNVSSLSDEDKKSIMEVLDGPGTYVEQEAALEKLACFPKLLVDVYPRLRLGQTEILTLKQKKSEAEISILAKAIAEGNARPGDTLSDKELAFAATLTPILTEKEAIYLAATKKSDSWQTHNNLGVVRLEMAKKASDATERSKLVDKAITNLEISRSRMENAEAYANLATAYLMKGDWAKIDEVHGKAVKISGNAEARRVINTVKGIVESRRGNYAAALGLLSNGREEGTAVFNKGLTQVLKKDWAAGYATLEELAATGSKNALVYYVQAIAAARQNKETEMLARLKRAIAMEASLKDRALADLEFLNFRNKPVFQDLFK